MKLTTCWRCGRTMVDTPFICYDCAEAVQQRVLWAIALLIPLGVCVVAFVVKEALE